MLFKKKQVGSRQRQVAFLFSSHSKFHYVYSKMFGFCFFSRSLFLALFKHLIFVGQRGCYRTALELSKLLLRSVLIVGFHLFLIIY